MTIRNRILTAFEVAEAEEDPRLHRDLLTFVLVGAGPGDGQRDCSSGTQDPAIAVPADRSCIRAHCVDRPVSACAGVIFGAAFRRRQEAPGEVGRSVEEVDAMGVIAGGERIVSKTVIWTAVVAPSPAAKWLNAESDRAGRNEGAGTAH